MIWCGCLYRLWKPPPAAESIALNPRNPGGHCVPVLLGLACGFLVAATANAAFPDVFSVQQAFALADKNHPSILAAKAQELHAESQLQEIRTDFQPALTFSAHTRLADKLSPEQVDFENDSRVFLDLDAPLSQFGINRALQRSMQTRIETSRSVTQFQTRLLRVEVLKKFLDVLLSDYAYVVANERMTLAFLEFEDVRQDVEQFAQGTDIDIAHYETLYLNAFALRRAAATRQRQSRIALALALNQYDSVPNQLVQPDLSVYQRPAPEYEAVLSRVLAYHPLLQSMHRQEAVLQEKLKVLGKRFQPTLGLSARAADFQRDTSAGRDRYRATLYLTVPLIRRPTQRAEMIQLASRQAQQSAQRIQMQQDLRLQVFDLVSTIEELQIEIRAAKSELNYRELELDKTRLLYEMEVQARIGLGNTRVAQAIYRLARAEYALAVAWETLDALTGEKPVDL